MSNFRGIFFKKESVADDVVVAVAVEAVAADVAVAAGLLQSVFETMSD